MVSSLRTAFNSQFSEAKYAGFLTDIEASMGYPSLFRLAETPVFVPKSFKNELLKACDSLFDTFTQPDFIAKTQRSLLPEQIVPNEDAHSLFLQIDFGVCELADGTLAPRLIEIQGFPSLYCFQSELGAAFSRNYGVPQDWSTYLNGYDRNSYINLLSEVILNGHAPENVVLLEIDPEKQATNIDFYATARAMGLHILNLADLRKNGRTLFYEKEGRKIRVHRIYNRVIFDELDNHKDRNFEFHFTDDVEVEWAGHPNWFFRISKFTLPLFNSPYVPETRFLSDVTVYPEDLSQFVLKPLFSFAGQGVKINVTKEDLDAVPAAQRSNFILQEKVNYAPIVATPDGPAKCEIRMMAVWKPGWDKPQVVNNICRLSKGEMVGVRYNKDKNWVGGTVCFFEP